MQSGLENCKRASGGDHLAFLSSEVFACVPDSQLVGSLQVLNCARVSVLSGDQIAGQLLCEVKNTLLIVD